MVVKRFTVALVNVLFPPLAVYLLCGVGHDLMLNSALFLLAVIPSHIHGFYISFTYFQRKRKVRKGLYPGSTKHMIHSEKVLNGGASNKEVRRLKREKDGVSVPRALKEKGEVQEKEPGFIKRAVSWRTKDFMPQELSSEYGYESDGHAPARGHSTHGRSHPRASKRNTIEAAPNRNKEIYDCRLQYSPTTDSDRDLEERPALLRRQTTQELVRRHSTRDRYTSASKDLARRSLASRPMEQRPPALPRRTYRSDIDGWLVRVEPTESA